MELTWWWLGLAVLLVILGVAGAAWASAGREQPADAVLVAHTRRLTALAAYRNAIARARLRLLALGALLVLSLLATAWVAARPTDARLVDPEKRNRDIMLCLDVSGSMAVTDQAILRSFADIVGGFQGERIGLVLFDSQAVTAFPLTDDYELVRTQLEEYAEGFGSYGGSAGRDPRAGTWNLNSPGTSLIPDGLASCVMAFDRQEDSTRPRAVILGTDNMVSGRGVYTHEEAFAEAKALGARVYAIDPSGFGPPHDQLVAATEGTGGRTFALDDEGAAAGITTEIERLEAARLPDTRAQYLRADTPRWPVLLLVVALLGYLPLAWRWRR